MSEEPSELSPDAQLDQSASDNSEPSCPVAPEPSPSILHLMVWATCVAVYMSAYRTIALDRIPQATESMQAVVFGAWGVLGGSYLAGLLLFIVRRVQGRKFPRSGGEILWCIGGITVLQGLTIQLLVTLTNSVHLWYTGLQIALGLFVWLPIYLYAITRNRGYWRLLFILLLIMSALWFLIQSALGSFGLRGIYFGLLCRMGVVAIALTLVALLDLRRDVRYPWPHWVGILLDLLAQILWATFYVVNLLTQDLSM